MNQSRALFASFYPKRCYKTFKMTCSIIYYFCYLMSNNEATISLKELSLFLLNLICNSCSILHQFSKGSELCWKGKNNPVTEVDYLIQHFLVTNIHGKYGENALSIVAEEDLTYAICPQFKESIQNKLFQFKVQEDVQQFPKAVQFEREYTAKDICIWIDPLDCTQGFINERKHEVTILVGISYKGVPICGLIGHPYKICEAGLKKSAVYQPSVYFGSSQLKLNSAFQYKVKQRVWITKEGLISDECQKQSALARSTTIGYRQMSMRQEAVVKELGLKVVRAGGAGYKCLKVINKEVGSLMFIDAKTSKWDTCAGQAIIKAMGGFTATQNLEQLQYFSDKSYENCSGFVFTLFGDLLREVANIVS